MIFLEILVVIALGLSCLVLANIDSQLGRLNKHFRERGHAMGGVEVKLERIRAELAKSAHGGRAPGYINQD